MKTADELLDLASEQGWQLELPDGVRYVLILIDGPVYVKGHGAMSASGDLKDVPELLETVAREARLFERTLTL